MSHYKTFNDGETWVLLATDANGVPSGAALGSYKSQKDADQALTTLRTVTSRKFGIVTAGKEQGFKLLNDKQWVAWYSNAAEDLEGEIFPRSETDAYIARLDSKEVPMPALWFWHIPGTKHGRADWVGRIGLMTVAVGHFDDTPLAQKFITHYRESEKQLSHGFLYDPTEKVGGIYGTYDTFEITTLPIGRAANPYTQFEVKEIVMDVEKLKALADIVKDDEMLTAIVTKGVTDSKELAALGVAFKALSTDGEGKPDSAKKKAEDEPTAEEKALDTRIQAAITAATKALTDQVVAVLKPLSVVIAEQQKTIKQQAADIKTLAKAVHDEFAMQPPATNNPLVQAQPNDTTLQAWFAQQNAQSGQKAMDELGVFGNIFQGMGLMGRKAQQTPFDFPAQQQQPQAQLSPEQMAQFVALQQQVSQQQAQGQREAQVPLDQSNPLASTVANLFGQGNGQQGVQPVADLASILMRQ